MSRVRGAEAVEFALTLPILVILVAGIFDYGWYFHQQLSLQSATRQAARSASVLPQTGDVDAAARASIAAALEADGQGGLDPAVTVEVVTAANGEQAVRVDATAPYTGLWSLVALPFQLRATVVMRREDQPDAT